MLDIPINSVKIKQQKLPQCVLPIFLIKISFLFLFSKEFSSQVKLGESSDTENPTSTPLLNFPAASSKISTSLTNSPTIPTFFHYNNSFAPQPHPQFQILCKSSSCLSVTRGQISSLMRMRGYNDIGWSILTMLIFVYCSFWFLYLFMTSKSSNKLFACLSFFFGN